VAKNTRQKRRQKRRERTQEAVEKPKVASRARARHQ
jgi:hypothetical protein